METSSGNIIIISVDRYKHSIISERLYSYFVFIFGYVYYIIH